MECVNHPGSQVAAYCQNCGRGICAECVAAWSQRPESRGLVLCPACVGLMQSPPPIYVPPVSSGPSPAAAAALGLIPGVGAMYNGQFLKGLIHVVIFAVLISITGHYGIFGIFIAAWVVYQSFEAYHTAKARRDGLPLPDPFGLNELSNWMNPTGHVHTAVPPVPPVPPQQPGAQVPPPFSGGAPQQPWGAGWQQPPYPPPPPGMPPVPPPGINFRRPEPIGAIVLIGLGVLFLLDQLDLFNGRIFSFSWPLLLIALGVWLIIRRVGDTQGGQK